MQSKENSLNKSDWKAWGKNVLLFSSPALIAFLMSLQGSFITGELPTRQHLMFAFGAMYSAFLAALIDLIRKYKEGK